MEVRPYPADPLYGVTRDGRVFRLAKPRAGRVCPYELVPHRGMRGYLTVAIGGRTTPVHRLVAETYIPRVLGKPEVAHNDGNRLNVHVDNLRWATRRENNDDRFGHGTVLRGEAIPVSKLTEQDVRIIHSRLASGFLQREVAAQFGVSRRAIGKINAGETWAHVN